MKRILVTAALILSAASAVTTQAQTQAPSQGSAPAFSYCGTYGAYVMLYKNTDQFEELGKLRCGEKLELLSKWFDYLQVRALDGKTGWVRAADVSGGPASAPSPTPFGLTNAARPPQHEVAVPLNNKNILAMQAMRLSPEVILAKIKSSPANFDTSPAALQRLKYAGISDKIIVAMVQAPDAAAAPSNTDAPKPPDFLELTVPDGTPVDLEMLASVSSDAVREGTIINLKVSRDVILNGITVFPKDSEARACVYVITQPGFMGKPGQVSWAMDDITAVNGDHLPATFAAEEPPTAGTPNGAVEDFGTTWEFHKNKPTTISAGHRLRATIHGNVTLKIPTALAHQSSVTGPAPASTGIQPSPEVPSSSVGFGSKTAALAPL